MRAARLPACVPGPPTPVARSPSESGVRAPGAAAASTPRGTLTTRNSVVSGECQWWIPDIIDAKIEGERVDMDEGIVRWHRYLRAGAP